MAEGRVEPDVVVESRVEADAVVESRVNCNLCNREYSERNFKRHNHRMHSHSRMCKDLHRLAKVKIDNCAVCLAVPNLQSHIDHVMEHDSSLPCDLCCTIYKENIGSLMEHIIRKHQETRLKYECHTCVSYRKEFAKECIRKGAISIW